MIDFFFLKNEDQIWVSIGNSAGIPNQVEVFFKFSRIMFKIQVKQKNSKFPVLFQQWYNFRQPPLYAPAANISHAVT